MKKPQKPKKPREIQKRTSGSKSLLTPETHAKFVELVRDGNHFGTACAAIGASENAVRRWIRNGEVEWIVRASGGTVNHNYDQHVLFCKEASVAMAEAETSLVRFIKNAAKRDWRAAKTMLERRWPERWGERLTVTVESELSKVFEKLEAKLSPDEYERILTIITAEDEPIAGVEQLSEADLNVAHLPGEVI